MAIQSSTFRKTEIENFLLVTDHKYAAACWVSDIVSETPTWLETCNWFSSYFPSNQAQFLFRLVECHCTQYWEMEENA